MTIDTDQVLNSAKAMKEQNEWEDIIPMAHIVHENGDQSVIGLPIPGGGPQLWMAVAEMVVTYRIAKGPVESLIYITEGYSSTTPASEDQSLQERWEAGDRDGMREALILTVAHHDGSMQTIFQPFDLDTKTWDEPVITDVAADEDLDTGGLGNVLRHSVSGTLPDGTKDDPYITFMTDAESNPVLQGAAQMRLGDMLLSDDGDTDGSEGFDPDEEFVRRVAAHSPPGGPSSSLSLEEYLDEDDDDEEGET